MYSVEVLLCDCVVILYALAMGESVTDAVERRRIHNQLLPNRTLIERKKLFLQIYIRQAALRGIG